MLIRVVLVTCHVAPSVIYTLSGFHPVIAKQSMWVDDERCGPHENIGLGWHD